MEKKSNLKFKILLVVFIFIFALGCRTLYDNLSYNGYEYPIYISEKLSFEKTDTYKYTIKCQFKNLTNEDVKIDKLHLYISGYKDSKTVIYDNKYLQNINIPAGDKYDLIINDYYYPVECKGYIKSFIINGIECNNIQYSPDGVTFEGPTSVLSTIVMLTIGIIGTVFCVIMINKNKKYNNALQNSIE